MIINGVGFEVIKSGTKQFERLLNMASRYDGHYVTDVYEKPSKEKIEIDDYWWDFSTQIEGTVYSICSHNRFMFTLSFVSDYGVHYITPTHNYLLVD